MSALQRRFKRFTKKIRGATGFLSLYNNKYKPYGTGASALGKNEYTYDPGTGVITSLNALSDEEEELDPYDIPEIANYPNSAPPVRRKGHTQEYINLEDISPEFGRMYYQPLVGRQHSYIHHLENSLTQTIIVGRKTGNIKALPEDGGLFKRVPSNPGTMNVKRTSATDSKWLNKAFSTEWDYQKPKDMSLLKGQKVNKVSVGTQITKSLYQQLPMKVQPIKQPRLVPIHATISEPIDYYAGNTSSEPPKQPEVPSTTTEPIPEEPKKKLKKAVSWGAWTLLEFIHVDDPRTNDLVRTNSVPNVGVQNLAKCAGKPNIR